MKIRPGCGGPRWLLGGVSKPMHARASRRSVGTVALTGALMILAGCDGDLDAPGAQPEDAEAGLEALEPRQEEFLAALAARDADRVSAFFAEDAVVHVADMPPIEGRVAIRGFYGNVFGFLTSTSATPERVRLAEGGGMAYGTGRTSNEFQGSDGPVAYSGKYLLVWRRLDDAWFVAAYSISSNHP